MNPSFSYPQSTPPIHDAPVGLLCDLLASPELTMLATTHPTFGWVVNGGAPGHAQQAYEIQLVTKEKNGTIWTTGRVLSSESINIPYAGPPLTPDGSYIWRVRTWVSPDGEPSPWSSEQRFAIAPGASTHGHDPVSAYPLQTMRIAPVTFSRQSTGRWIGDFGKQAFGWLEIELESPADGLTVTVHLGEALRDGVLDREPPGSVRYAESNMTTRAGRHVMRVPLVADRRNTGPSAIALPAEIGVIMPFRHIEVACAAPGVVLHGAIMSRVQYPFDSNAASFACSDPFLNRLWEVCHHTMLATTFAGYYVDGDRERIPYEADAYINQLGHYATDREYSLARRTHEYLLAHPTWPTEWKQHSILMAWADYEATGDKRSLRRSYDRLKREKLLLEHARPDGLLATGHLRESSPGRTDIGDLVDWPPVERDDYDFGEINTVVNALHYRTLVLMAKIAGALGHSDDANHFTTLAQNVFTSFNLRLFDETTGVYVDGENSTHASQHANLFTLACGLVPDARRTAVIAHLKAKGMSCSVYPAHYLLEGLFEAREADHAVALMTGGGLRSWRNMLDHDATLTWEAWDQSLKPNQDWNHAWGAAPANIIARYVLGVRPLEPGYARVLIDPQLGDLTEVSGIVPTIRGPIKVRAWKDADGRTRHEAQVPANVQIG